MKQFVAVASLLGLASAEPFYGTPLATTYASAYAPAIAAPAIRTVGYAAPAVRTIAAAPVAAVRTIAAAPAVAAAPVIAQPAPVTYASTASIKAVPAGVHAQQYHAQDEFGNYEYGYDNPNSQKKEAGNAALGVKGHYTVKDAYGLNRRIDYVADAAGFRAAGAGIWKREADAEAFYGLATPLATTYASAYAPAIAAPAIRTVGYTAPAVVAAPAVAAPVISRAPAVAAYAAEPAVYQSTASVKAVPAGVHAQQYHSQDEFGNYSYGYANPNSQKQESGNAYTGVQGSYSYVDSYGLNRKVNYVADGLGFRASPAILH